MAADAASDNAQTASCPHCRKPFSAELWPAASSDTAASSAPTASCSSRRAGSEHTALSRDDSPLAHMQFFSACASGRPSSFFSVLFSI